MNGTMPMDRNMIDAVNAIIARRMQEGQALDMPMKESAFGGPPIQDMSPVAATGMPSKPMTQKKVPHDMMQKILKTRIYELPEGSQLDAETVNLIDTGLYR